MAKPLYVGFQVLMMCFHRHYPEFVLVLFVGWMMLVRLSFRTTFGVHRALDQLHYHFNVISVELTSSQDCYFIANIFS